MPEKYRVAIIGSTGRGDYGHGIDLVWQKFPDQIQVVAVADPVEKGRLQAQTKTGASRAYVDYLEMLEKEKPQIVAIGPRWTDQHADMVVASAEHGCHIYMEKPFCRTLIEADKMVAACEKAKVKLGIAHVARYSPILPAAQKVIADGTIGNVLEIRARGKEDKRGGCEDMWVLGSHMFNLMNALAGQPVACNALLRQGRRPVVAADIHDGPEGLGPMGGDSLHAQFEFESGIQGFFASIRNQAGRPWRFAIQIFGSKGMIEIPSGYLEPAWLLVDSSWSPGRSGKNWVKITSAGPDQPEPIKEKDYGNTAAVKDLLAAIADQREPLCNVYAARTTIEMIMGAFESHRQGGGLVKLPLVDRRHPLTLL